MGTGQSLLPSIAVSGAPTPGAAATGIPLTNDEIKGRTALYTEMAQESAYRELQRAGVDPEIETEVEAYRQRRIQKKKQALQTSVPHKPLRM